MTITSDEYLEIDGVPLATFAWKVVDLSPLWEGPDVRGGDRLIPGAAGVRAYPRRATVSQRSLPMLVFGAVDQDGAPYPDPREGLETNFEYLRTNVADPTNLGAGTRVAVLHLPSGATRTADVHVEALRPGPLGPSSMRAVLTLSIPGGVLS